jgi:hypothetical protein
VGMEGPVRTGHIYSSLPVRDQCWRNSTSLRHPSAQSGSKQWEWKGSIGQVVFIPLLRQGISPGETAQACRPTQHRQVATVGMEGPVRTGRIYSSPPKFVATEKGKTTNFSPSPFVVGCWILDSGSGMDIYQDPGSVINILIRNIDVDSLLDFPVHKY